jgi:hypothetical protein
MENAWWLSVQQTKSFARVERRMMNCCLQLQEITKLKTFHFILECQQHGLSSMGVARQIGSRQTSVLSSCGGACR